MAANKDKTRAAAQKFLQKGQLDKAIREYQRLIEDDPKDVRTLLKIGDLQTRNEKPEQAVETYSRVAEFYSEQGFFLKAVAVYKQILRLNTQSVEVNLKLAELYDQLGLISDATNQYREVSQILEQEGRVDESIEILRKMVEIDSDNVASRIKLAEMFAKLERVEEAAECFQIAAKYLKSHRRVDDFIKVAERIIHLKPDDLDTTRELAKLYVEHDEPRRALAKLQVCFKANPKDVDTLDLLAEAFRALGQNAKTLSVYRELGRIYAERGDTESQRATMYKILELEPDDVEAQQALENHRSGPRENTLGRIKVAQKAVRRNTDVREINRARGALPSDTRPTVSPAERNSSDPVAQEAANHDDGLAIEVDIEADNNNEHTETEEEAINRILLEAEVYVKYGLKTKALDHIRKIFDIDANHREARTRYKDLLIDTGELDAGVSELMRLAQLNVDSDADTTVTYLRELLRYDPGHEEALDLLQRLRPNESIPDAAEFDDSLEDDFDIEPTLSYEPSQEAAEIDLDDDDDTDIEPLVHVDDDIESLVEDDLEPDDEPTLLLEDDVEDLERLDDAETLSTLDDDDEFFKDGPEPEIQEKSAPAEAPPTRPELTELDELLAGAVPGKANVPSESSNVDDTRVDSTPAGHQPDDETDLTDEIEEIQFFLVQGLESEAKEQLNALLQVYGERSDLLELQATLTSEGAGPDAAPPLSEKQPFDDEDDDVASFDLSTDLAADIDELAEDSRETDVAFQNVFDEFKKGVEEVVEAGDYQTHYDLGIAYKEMDLYQDAIREFEQAARSDEKAIGALTMMGLCTLAIGDETQALGYFQQGLNSAWVTADEALALRFEIGAAYEQVGRLSEAIKFFEKVESIDPEFRGVRSRVLQLKKMGSENALQSQPKVDGELDQLLIETDAEIASREKSNKISYI